MNEARQRAAFATTRWTTITAANCGSDDCAATALAELCEIYWPPLYAYLRNRGHRPEQAQDLTQGFFAHLLETHAIRAADPTRGRFRAFLLTALKRYVINEYARSVSQRRGGYRADLALNFEAAERAYRVDRRNDDNPERIFDRKWAAIVLDRAVRRLHDECEQAGKSLIAEALLPYLTDAGDLPSHRQVAAQLKLTEGAVKVAVHRLRQRYGAILRMEIAETVADAQEIEPELRELLRVVST